MLFSVTPYVGWALGCSSGLGDLRCPGEWAVRLRGSHVRLPGDCRCSLALRVSCLSGEVLTPEMGPWLWAPRVRRAAGACAPRAPHRELPLPCLLHLLQWRFQ